MILSNSCLNVNNIDTSALRVKNGMVSKDFCLNIFLVGYIFKNFHINPKFFLNLLVLLHIFIILFFVMIKNKIRKKMVQIHWPVDKLIITGFQVFSASSFKLPGQLSRLFNLEVLSCNWCSFCIDLKLLEIDIVTKTINFFINLWNQFLWVSKYLRKHWRQVSNGSKNRCWIFSKQIQPNV